MVFALIGKWFEFGGVNFKRNEGEGSTRGTAFVLSLFLFYLGLFSLCHTNLITSLFFHLAT